MNHIYTTRQAADICKTTPRQVCQWFYSGRLKGFRIPGSQQIRIPKEYLDRFLSEQSMTNTDQTAEATVTDEALLLAASDALEAFLEMCVDERLIHSDACQCETCETQANGRRVQRLIDARLETTT